jgi:chemotaxis protein methyltransferase CheR
MRDSDCVEFLQWALPRLRMRWSGFRKVRGQVRKRLARRLDDLAIPDLEAYRAYLESTEGEWERLDSLCRITISRFYRDRAVWKHLEDAVLPELADAVLQRGENGLRCCSLGCASGEEPYTLAMVWNAMPVTGPRPALHVLACDADAVLLERARRGVYPTSSLRDLPARLRGCFTGEGEEFELHPAVSESVELVRLDVRVELPDGPFHLVLCRNLVFTYYEDPLQRSIRERLSRRLIPGGVLVIGIHESLPAGQQSFAAREERLGIYSRI